MGIKKFLAFVVLSFSAFATLYPSSSASALWGGVEVADPDSYPDPNAKYVLFVHAAGGYCTGTVLSRHFALTAAHCRSPHHVFLGNNTKARQGFRVQSSKEIPGSDVRVLLIDPKTPFSFPTYPQLPNKEVERDSTGYLYGWGTYTKQLLKGGSIKLLGFYNRFGTTGAMINTRQNDPRVCPGDSGGPTYQNGKIVAITSSGVVARECGNWGGLSSVYKALTGIRQALQELAPEPWVTPESVELNVPSGTPVPIVPVPDDLQFTFNTGDSTFYTYSYTELANRVNVRFNTQPGNYGLQDVSLTIGDFNKVIKADVLRPVDISIAQAPDKLIYRTGEELDLAGLKLSVTFARADTTQPHFTKVYDYASLVPYGLNLYQVKESPDSRKMQVTFADLNTEFHVIDIQPVTKSYFPAPQNSGQKSKLQPKLSAPASEFIIPAPQAVRALPEPPVLAATAPSPAKSRRPRAVPSEGPQAQQPYASEVGGDTKPPTPSPSVSPGAAPSVSPSVTANQPVPAVTPNKTSAAPTRVPELPKPAAPSVPAAVAPAVPTPPAPLKPTVLAGEDRYVTNAKVASNAFSSADTIFLASGEDFADALSAGPAAIVSNAPLLLSAKNFLPESIISAIKSLKAKKAVIVGGVNAIGENVENTIKSLGLDVRRIAGKNRFLTNKLIIDEFFPNASSAFVASAYSYADSLSASSIASLQSLPVVLVSGKYSIDAKFQQVTLVGGEKVLSSPSNANALQVERIFGQNRLETSALLLKKASFNSLAAVNAYSFADALSAVNLAKLGAATVLTSSDLGTGRNAAFIVGGAG